MGRVWVFLVYTTTTTSEANVSFVCMHAEKGESRLRV